MSNDQAKLKLITDEVMERFDDLATIMELGLNKGRKSWYGACPIHGGDNPHALDIYFRGRSYVGNWQCHTHQCEDVFLNSVIGFVRGCLSRNRYGWHHKGDKMATFKETMDFLMDFLEKKEADFTVDEDAVNKRRFTSHMESIYGRQRPKIQTTVTRSDIRRSLSIPAEYYLSRGYSESILDKYDVGLCENKHKPMYGRVVAPVYDDNHKYMMGCTGRSIFERCAECGMYHNPKYPCPDKSDQWKFSKWRHSANFHGADFLYNYWYAKKHIQQKNSVILVESPGNVWRLVEAGWYNVVGLFGSALSEGQRSILDSSGALTLILCLDNDEAGKSGTQKIIKECNRIYNVRVVELPDGYEDVGEMPTAQVKELPFER